MALRVCDDRPMTTQSFTIEPKGRFSLAAAQDFAEGFPAGTGASGQTGGLLMTFPIEGWRGSAAVNVRQDADGTIHGETADANELDTVTGQVARSLSIDHDGTGWIEVGDRDPVLGAVQKRYGWLRPVCFFSAYEAATSFVIGHRISMRQARIVKERLGTDFGDETNLGGQTVHAFPRPQRLLEATSVKGLSQVKVERLHGLAQAAIDGRLMTDRLREMPEAEALDDLERLPGVGPWTAQAVLMRGCGVADAIPLKDDISRAAVASFYDLSDLPDDVQWATISDPWRPFRMWATVLLHMAWRREEPTPSYRQSR